MSSVPEVPIGNYTLQVIYEAGITVDSGSYVENVKAVVDEGDPGGGRRRDRLRHRRDRGR